MGAEYYHGGVTPPPENTTIQRGFDSRPQRQTEVARILRRVMRRRHPTGKFPARRK